MEAPPTATAALHPEPVDSSPRSTSSDSHSPHNIRLMCSYGGHIIPRPHDKALCYVGGDTRIILLPRHSSLSDLRHSLSKTLLHNHSFILRYKLPNDDLDSLISLSNDEDLDNMVDEYDRLSNAAAGSKSPPPRLRLFLFPKTPSPNIQQILVDTASSKSDDWFYNALNGKGSALSGTASDRGFSDTSSVNHLLGLDDDFGGKSGKGSEPKFGGCGSGNHNSGIISQDVHSVPDSPMLETTSSFGSTSSSLSGPNLPPIKVHVEENPKVGGFGIEDQFQHLNVGVQKQEGVVVGRVVPAAAPIAAVGGEYAYRVISDDEKSDHGGYRKQEQVQLHIPRIQVKQTGAFDMHSPDSVSSEPSVVNPLSRQRQVVYQDPIIQVQSANARVTGNQSDQSNTKVQMQPEPGYVISGQYDQSHPHLHPRQQFVQLGGNQYIPAGAMPLAPYYPIYHSQQQHQPALDQQYPVYYVPARPPQGYNIPVQQPGYSEPGSTVGCTRPQPPTAYSQAINIPCSKPEMVYRTTAGAGPQLVQIPYGQHQQYVGYKQMQPPPSSGNEFSDPSHAQIYYNQHLPAAQPDSGISNPRL